MQANSQWRQPAGTLGAIVGEAEERARLLEQRRPDLEADAEETLPGPSLARALRGTDVAVLAEVKRRSPSKGSIDDSLDAVTQARAYVDGGAVAVSILTEANHFGGTIDDLQRVRANLDVPVLKKDFHVAPIQLLEARALGASAALLIARAIAPARLAELMEYARTIGLDVLVEVRDDDELRRAIECGAAMIGVNNRNLETLEIDPHTAERLIPTIPANLIAIAESGVASRTDVERYAERGADAVLVGSALSAAPDPLAATRQLCGVPRRRRAG
ncbi:MAG: indole-3-glycerol phosphate synthase TrpC [Gemmatimonadaceae bacterium]